MSKKLRQKILKELFHSMRKSAPAAPAPAPAAPAPAPAAPAPAPAAPEFAGYTGAQSFRCPPSQSLAVGIFQQLIGATPDCKVGPKTIAALKSSGKAQDLPRELKDYIVPGQPLTDQQKRNQQLFCSEVQKYQAANTQTLGAKAITQCPYLKGATSGKQGMSPDNPFPSKEGLTHLSDLAGQNQYDLKNKKLYWRDPSRGVIESVYDANGKFTKENVVQPITKESYNFYDAKKIKNAHILYEKLIKLAASKKGIL